VSQSGKRRRRSHYEKSEVCNLLSGADFRAAVHVQAEDAYASLTRSELPQFLASYEQSLKPIDTAYADLIDQPFPMREDSGKRVSRGDIKNRRKIIADLRVTARELASSPEDLVLALTLFDLTEKLGDDLYDLSQIAYDMKRSGRTGREAD